MTTLTTPLAHHHQHCDSLYAQAENAAQDGDWPACQPLSRQFVAQMETHFSTEESLLFPALEQATGITTGPTMVMRQEHGMMRELMEELLQAADAADLEAFEGACGTLLVLMQQHNLKEEHILYPMCDRSLPGTALPAQLTHALGDISHA